MTRKRREFRRIWRRWCSRFFISYGTAVSRLDTPRARSKKRSLKQIRTCAQRLPCWNRGFSRAMPIWHGNFGGNFVRSVSMDLNENTLNCAYRIRSPPQEIRRQCLSPGTEPEKWMRRPARLSKPSLDDLFQRGFTEHEPACGKRLAERKRPASDRKRVRFSPAFAHRFTLRDGTRDRHSSH